MAQYLKKQKKNPFTIIYDSLYESDSKVIWGIVYLNMVGVGQLKQLIGIKLTEFGYIQFTCASFEKDFDKYDEEFREIIRSVHLNDNEIYQIE